MTNLLGPMIRPLLLRKMLNDLIPVLRYRGITITPELVKLLVEDRIRRIHEYHQTGEPQ